VTLHRCGCGARALYRRPRGGFAVHRDHPLCFRCWRAERDRSRASGKI